MAARYPGVPGAQSLCANPNPQSIGWPAKPGSPGALEQAAKPTPAKSNTMILPPMAPPPDLRSLAQRPESAAMWRADRGLKLHRLHWHGGSFRQITIHGCSPPASATANPAPWNPPAGTRADPVLTRPKSRVDLGRFETAVFYLFSRWCRKRGSNPRPRHYE